MNMMMMMMMMVYYYLFVITFMQDIYNYILETKQVSTVCNVAAIL
jgi:hypothetical protein